MKKDASKLLTEEDLVTTGDTSEIDAVLEFEEILLSISETIIQYRKENNLTQKQLAELLECKQEMISKLESGENNPTFKTIHKISRQIDNSSDFFETVLKNIIEKLQNIPIKTYNTSICLEKHAYQNNNVKELFHISWKGKDYNRAMDGGISNEEYTSCLPDAG